MSEPGMISASRAREIAEDAIATTVKRAPDAPVRTALDDGVFTVTFVHETPETMLGADYDALVRVDGRTGQILEIRVGA